jgi:hypothetical protein
VCRKGEADIHLLRYGLEEKVRIEIEQIISYISNTDFQMSSIRIQNLKVAFGCDIGACISVN